MPHSRRASEIKVAGIGKSYGAFCALKDVSLDIGRGEFLTLLGPSGSGKSTFLMVLAGFERPSQGKLFRDGVDITDQPPERRSAGMVFQGYALFPHMSVAANIAFPLRVRRKPEDEIKRRVGEMVERVGLLGHEHKLPAKLSGGQQQRVALARALVFEPGVLLLDEPFSALDKSLRGQMQAEMKRLHEETGTTFVFVTHDQSEALALSSRVSIFNHGEVLQVGTPQEVYERPSSRFVAEFLGEINILPLRDVRPANGGARGLVEDREVALGFASGDVRGEAVLAVRPEHMSIAREPHAQENSIAVSAVSSTYLGSAVRLELVTRGGSSASVCVPMESARHALEGSDTVWLTWPAGKGFLLPASG
ncbi:ABC transporter ATP-binding protein [Sinorhizobium medicae]|uniref:ABC transporter ATP-binding protein n=1 Tax=Sinorhizobium medicae TaxID=110321 RepID=UPI000FDCD601|nr:ABC transporter ATP-binding protein [Sinorhizobium medicae]RVJ31706.1 ABC transporter ATP-binding protein [Sinorhizobium medicae]